MRLWLNVPADNQIRYLEFRPVGNAGQAITTAGAGLAYYPNYVVPFSTASPTLQNGWMKNYTENNRHYLISTNTSGTTEYGGHYLMDNVMDTNFIYNNSRSIEIGLQATGALNLTGIDIWAAIESGAASNYFVARIYFDYASTSQHNFQIPGTTGTSPTKLSFTWPSTSVSYIKIEFSVGALGSLVGQIYEVRLVGPTGQ